VTWKPIAAPHGSGDAIIIVFHSVFLQPMRKQVLRHLPYTSKHRYQLYLPNELKISRKSKFAKQIQHLVLSLLFYPYSNFFIILSLNWQSNKSHLDYFDRAIISIHTTLKMLIPTTCLLSSTYFPGASDKYSAPTICFAMMFDFIEILVDGTIS
jgi:hypothetical protein